MAQAISSEELQLRKRARRRLVGAVALVLVVVVFLPMFLDNDPKPVSEDIAINIPPPPVATELPSEQDLSTAPSETQEPSAPSEPLRFRPVEESSGAATSSEPDSKPEASAPRQPATVTAKQEFVVQLGAFSDAGNAARLANKVRESQFDAYTEVVTTSGGKRTRVRVGPYATRAEAEQARDRLKARKLTYGEPDIVRRGE